MKLNHLNLTVNDVQESRDFLETYFGMKCIGSRGDAFAALFDDDGFVLTLMKGKNVKYPKTFHIGFPQENKEKVDQINERLRNDGFNVDLPIEAHGYTFYVQSPGGFTVEVLS
ncbi:VOC family protein [Cytobacillus purgationiresistens]|uniref:Catechol 2,3-dioxygenase-like lactoylglutathione lyase family enzyme n=1 Tax=Cytobacillus purgationiresistens TaxID=863449 RepID=A0ABU0AAV7_9BACI|nr:VOC family protein [Cytobacillus purgationiresistens]MDQ0268155.1 catechol 2,3-dioxygenase-like lactoylglutathione lyase family enzyme [Cytobacillus purgationiresistens]